MGRRKKEQFVQADIETQINEETQTVSEPSNNVDELKSVEIGEGATIQPNVEPKSLDENFADMEKFVSEFKPDEQSQNQTSPNGSTQAQKPTIEQQIKIRIFLGLCCYLISGLNTFLLNKIRKSQVPIDKMQFTEGEKESLLPYFNSPEILNFMDKIPASLMAVIHIEYIMFMKHSLHVDEYKKVEGGEK